ncbi:type I-C CRISPR-associated protein Cas8c/Csd1 [Pseudoflavonifractor sp. 60]|uniref:type I-C CRISPR-associated protein Cas8c/Csd1 n=1 Tax=Pseudoflavonifractor sp. 60 TaxID=2304576 RepID=UPI00136A3827|nr:type I-C CRISPR-associated protein Cas8c/Csd1 [Pseudoflavonifractor sp. 60]NBI67384.1 type I-C CRISPR-associated protein Cas8c/Csd1 [Pseudoflavonifractor sp. 60]
MILQALVEHYEDLAAQGRLDRPGWSGANISYALYISDAGELEQVVSLKQEEERGKKKVWVPRTMSLPAPVKRSSGVASNFLWDNSSYILGIDEKGKPQRSLECFAACKALHHQLLDHVDSSGARAVLAFFDHWDPAQARAHPALADKLQDILAGANLVFRYDSGYPQDDPQIRAAWQEHYDSAGDGPELVCLVTGRKGPAEAVHPAIKGVARAQSSGAALVSFNGDAFCSYGREQSYNAPTSKYAAFAYTSALNHLLAERDYVGKIGNITVLFWASGGQRAYQSFSVASLFGAPTSYSSSDLQKMMLDLCQGKPVLFEETQLDPGTPFYILGLSPNAARLSVRFFLKNSFGAFIQNIQAHQERLEIVRTSFDKFETLPLWKLLDETVNPNSKDKSPVPGMAGETLRAILNDTPYPATLLNGVALRVRAEREITRGRAAILKAYYLKNPHPDVPKEVLTVSLNPDSTNIPYTLGRLFSVLEAIQSAANPGINTTIKDKYFNSASATPSRVFPTLINLAQKHLRKLDKGWSISFSKQLTELTAKLEEEFPDRLSLPQQGAFQLGYYHQTQARYQKKEENNNA